MRNAAAARRYAKALFSLAQDADRVADVRGELEALAQVFRENDAVREAVLTPLHPASERRGVLAALSQQLGLSAALKNFVSFLVDQRRLVSFDDIVAEYARLSDEASGIVRADVRAAAALTPDQEASLKSALSRRTGHDVQLDISIDPTLLGGAVAQVGDLVFDGSLRTQLAQLRANLTKGQ
ncbi:MAG: F0F1 ATP synthase subunit delta [Proteobacteria bacterium]|nr:F0F1 ATP synthase subunit delta [Pseudomonadota bacterium]